MVLTAEAAARSEIMRNPGCRNASGESLSGEGRRPRNRLWGMPDAETGYGRTWPTNNTHSPMMAPAAQSAAHQSSCGQYREPEQPEPNAYCRGCCA